MRTSVTIESLEAWVTQTNEYANTTAKWIEANMGSSARDRFLDMSGPSYSFNNALGNEHQNSLNWLHKVSTNLQVLIERSDAYDEAPGTAQK
ncbi:hypothetical protein EDE08_101629 [Bradyrhizobium sp. R2.2-H]|nr:hypothetical protein EDE10_101630 [Bradyrhizobium sp. Y-H1]TCU80930.1 hypothetical protein EDE08_101629 [Bradyrhizobium sp. R2.2-H]